MKKLTILGVVTCVLLMLVPVAVLSAPAGPPDGLDVKIVNPLPVPVTGEVDANVTGDVNATVSGSVNVIKAIEPVAIQAGSFLNRGCPFSEEIYTVPDGKFLIIEDASAAMILYSGDTVVPDGGVSVSLYSSNGTTGYVAKARIVGGNELPLYGGRMVRFYAGPGEIVIVEGEGCNNDHHVNVSVSFVGQLINVP